MKCSVFAVAATMVAGSAVSADLLFDNGGFVTHPGQGANGSDASQVDTAFFGIGTLFYPGGQGTEYRVAEDFEVQPGWTIETIRVYGYQQVPAGTFPVPPAPFASVVMNIWNGPPLAAGSSIVATSTTLGGTKWTGAYRVENGMLQQDTRPIYGIEIEFPGGLSLSPGTYWYDVQVTGGQAVTPYVMDGLVNADGNAMNLFLDSVGFNPIKYGSPSRGLAFPFQVFGTGSAPACYANCDGSTAAPILNVSDFGCFLNKFAAGDPYANCDESTGSPVLNVADFGCFLNKFAAGCR